MKAARRHKYSKVNADDIELNFKEPAKDPMKDRGLKANDPAMGSTPLGTPTYSISAAYSWLRTSLGPRGVLAMIGVSALTVVESLTATAPALLLGQVVDIIADDEQPNDQIWPLFGYIGGGLVLLEIVTVMRKWNVEKKATELYKSAFMQQAGHLLNVRVDALQAMRAGDLTVRLDKSVEGLIKLQKVTFMELLPNLFTAIAALAMSFHEHWSLCIVMISTVLLGSLVTRVQVKSQKGIRVNLHSSKSALGGSVSELLGSLSYIRASGMRNTQLSHLGNAAEHVRNTEFTHHKYMMSFDGMKNTIQSIGFVSVIGMAIHLASTGQISSGSILSIALLYQKAAAPLQALHKVIDGAHEAVISVGALETVRALPPDPGLEGAATVPAHGYEMDGLPVDMKDVSVTLGHVPDAPQVLQELSLVVHRGESIGIAGGSGSGKSTLLKCILGLIPDYEGSVHVMGTEVLDARRGDLSASVAYAQQEPFMITGTLRENLVCVGEAVGVHISDQQLLDVLEKVHLGMSDHKHVWVDGLDTHIHEGGRNLSGGQKQRLALARVLLSDSHILVLDEATSALDNQTEASVIRELARFSEHRTVLMVAHRLSTLRWTDRILVMEGGQIVQSGSYEELSQVPGAFQQLLTAESNDIDLMLASEEHDQPDQSLDHQKGKQDQKSKTNSHAKQQLQENREKGEHLV